MSNPTRKKTKESTAMRLIRLVWDHNREGTGFSWTRLNGSMHQAVVLAISAGLKFNPGDFTEIAQTMRIGYWSGNDRHMCGERFYSEAVKYDHPTAYQSFEAWKNRKPFIWDGQRISVGHQFIWQGQRVTCTSFAADGLSLIATATTRKFRPDGYLDRAKVARRFTITDADLRAARKALKPKPQPEHQEATTR